MDLTPKKKLPLARADQNRRQTEVSLKQFVKGAWPILEPVTKLQWNWHLELLCEHLQRVREGRPKRLIINVPPRTMKSTVVTVCWPVWWWASEPETRS